MLDMALNSQLTRKLVRLGLQRIVGRHRVLIDYPDHVNQRLLHSLQWAKVCVRPDASAIGRHEPSTIFDIRQADDL